MARGPVPTGSATVGRTKNDVLCYAGVGAKRIQKHKKERNSGKGPWSLSLSGGGAACNGRQGAQRAKKDEGQSVVAWTANGWEWVHLLFVHIAKCY